MATRIITDSTGDLPLSYAQEHDLLILPFPVSIGGHEYQVGPDPTTPNNIDVAEFYRRIAEGERGSTSQVSLETYLDVFKRELDTGVDVLYLAFGSGLSGTVNSARLAAEELAPSYPSQKIRVVDTLSASVGEGMVVTETVKKFESGVTDVDELAAYTESIRLKVHHWFTINDLHYLAKGGRLSGSAAFAGSLLNIKPILDVSVEGKLVPREKVQGRKKSIKALADKFFSLCTDIQNTPVYIGHSGCAEDAQILVRLIEERSGRKVDLFEMITPVITSHTGIGTVALFFMTDTPRNP